MTDQPIRLGIIGCGIMGERMLRAAIDHALGLVTITGMWDAAPNALERLATVHPGRAADAETVIDGADCVYVATPPGTHLDYAARALAAGKAVFLEKPLATDTGTADAFVRANAGQRVAVNFPFASSFAVERLRGWIDEGTIGAPTALDVEVAFATWPRAWQQAAASWLDGPAEGGFTREVISHFLFLARRVLGPLALQTAHVVRAPNGTEQGIEARLTAGGLRTGLRGGVGTTDKDDHNTWTLHGSNGALRLRDWSIAEQQRPDGTWATDPDAQPNERMRPLVLRRQLEGVAAMTRGQAHRLATLSEAFEVQVAVEAMLSTPRVVDA